MTFSIRANLMRLINFADPIIGRMAAIAPDRVRFGSDFVKARRALTQQAKNSHLSETRQLEALKKTLICASQTDYWKPLLASLDPNENPIQTLESLPVLSREELSKSADAMCDRKFKTDLVTTSGSSGNFLAFHISKNRRSYEWAHVLFAWAASGYTSKDWRLVLRGAPVNGTKTISVNHAMREIRVPSTRTDDQTYLETLNLIRRHNVKYLHGYPSALTAFSKWLRSHPFELSQTISGIFPVSEPFSLEQYEIIKASFPQASILPFYGLTEKSAFGITLDPESFSYTLIPTYGFVEILDSNNKPVEIGGRGRVVSTRLGFPGSSLIRYDTGDTARLVEKNTNGAASVIDAILPRRASGTATASDGTEVELSPGFYERSSLFSEKILEFQIRQPAPGEIRLLVLPMGPIDLSFKHLLENEVKGRLGDRFTASVEFVDSIPHTGNGKRPMLVKEFLN